MKHYIILLKFLFLSSALFAQQNTISGKVNTPKNEPLPGVSIYLKNSNTGTITNIEGLYTLTNLPSGRVTIIAQLLGYEQVEKTVSLIGGNLSVDFTLNESTEELAEVIIASNRETGYVAQKQSSVTFGARDIKDVPFSISVITQEVLLDQQVRALGDLVRNDPSVIVSNPPGFNETINIRGFNLDNSSSYRRENLIFQNQVQSPFENKAAVEIVKGPAAIRYGFTPPGGIINYVLKRPTKDPLTFLQTFGDNFGTVGIHGDFGGQVNDAFGYRINALVANESSYVRGIAGPRQLFSALFEWKPNDKLTIDFEAEYQYRELEQQAIIGLNSFDASLTDEQRRQILRDFDPRTFIGQQWGTYPTRNFIGSVGVQYEFNENWKLEGRIQKMNLIRDQQGANIANRSLQANGDFLTQVFFDPAQVRDPLSLETYVTGKFSTFNLKHRVAAGVAYSHNPLKFSTTGSRFNVGQSNIFNPVDLEFPDNGLVGPTVEALVFTQKAFYITDFIEISDKFEILAAMRYTEQKNEDVFNDQGTLQESYKDNIVTPNFGLIYKPKQELSLYASYSMGVTTGAAVPEIANNFGTEFFLDPVQTEQYELGLKAELFKKALFTASVFDIDQPLALLDNNNIFRYGGRQRHRGTEMTLSGQVTNDLRLILGGTYLDASIENSADASIDGQRPASVPQFQGNIFADYYLPFLKNLSVNTGLYYTGDRFADNFGEFKVDGYVRVDLGARYEFNIMGKELAARLNVRNITNNRFIEGMAFGQFLFGAPTTAIFSLAANF